MEKPALLRAEIEKHLPELKNNPEKLTLFVQNGRVSGNKHTLGHEVRYTLALMIDGYTGDTDILNAVILNWARRHQPDLLAPGHVPDNAYRLEADILDNRSCDLLIELALSERITVTADNNGQVTVRHQKPPTEDEMANILHGGSYE